jgi:hypothetical protein
VHIWPSTRAPRSRSIARALADQCARYSNRELAVIREFIARFHQGESVRPAGGRRGAGDRPAGDERPGICGASRGSVRRSSVLKVRRAEQRAAADRGRPYGFPRSSSRKAAPAAELRRSADPAGSKFDQRRAEKIRDLGPDSWYAHGLSPSFST